MFTGASSVAYGASGQFAVKALSGGTACTNAVFGDPLYGVGKACYLQTGAATPAPAPIPVVPTAKTDAARLLIQATYGPNMVEINRAAAMGPAAWISDQFTTPSRDTHWNYVMVRKGPIGCTVCDARYITPPWKAFGTRQCAALTSCASAPFWP